MAIDDRYRREDIDFRVINNLDITHEEYMQWLNDQESNDGYHYYDREETIGDDDD